MSHAAKKLTHLEVPPVDLEYQWNRRVLVVEDEIGIAETYKEILCPDKGIVVPFKRSSRSKEKETVATENQPSFELTICNSGEAALEEVKKSIKNKKPFALGFFDVLLGEGIDGFELVKEIQKIDSDLYAVFVTAYNDRSIDSINQFLGRDNVNRWDYLNKPFTGGEILQKARNFVSLYNLHKVNDLREAQLSEVQRQLRESERLTAVATVARGVGHEFGNLLMQILGNADVARDKEPEQMKKALEKIIDASQRANDILDRFKDLSEADEGGFQMHNCSVHKIIDEALALMEHQFKASNVKVCRIKNDHVEANVNSTAVLQVIINLSINSMHAMLQSGGQIDYSLVDKGKGFEIVIRDYGPGIDDEIIHKVTEAFFTTKGKSGTGLGLAICKEIVEIEHYGEFSIKNHERMGFEVKMYFPYEQNEGVKK